jgi:hypothetical protein
MPAEHLFDKLILCCRYSAFKCRACRAKFYRPSSTVPRRIAPEAEVSTPLRDVGVCQGDPATTLRRIENVILVAERMRLRKG